LNAICVQGRLLTNAIDKNARQDEIVDIEHGPSPQSDDVGNVRVRLRAARIELDVSDGVETNQIELTVGLVVRHISLLRLFHQVQLCNIKLLNILKLRKCITRKLSALQKTNDNGKLQWSYFAFCSFNSYTHV